MFGKEFTVSYNSEAIVEHRMHRAANNNKRHTGEPKAADV